jgi:hypothetical protein
VLVEGGLHEPGLHGRVPDGVDDDPACGDPDDDLDDAPNSSRRR